ncbi:GNAT family N-acetyltransferase [Crossiella sp. SN42]|uniref:GNAT family N-acetyltransferase n=1 Tax=Crossiella sp. SN42 TaxID=2944808 RepID=UPI00207CDBDE|nr:GNAT family N-acetyltransferase [Crossiella sp. SN42]MCO1576645.1 GNAT family N-acetyltransferase [Crossiella sp. SN42]
MLVERITGSALAGLGPRLTSAYAEAFAAPPYGYDQVKVDRAMARLGFAATQPEATAAVVSDQDGAVAGAAWGWVTPPGLHGPESPFAGLYAQISDSIGGAAVAGALLPGRFELVELFTRPAHQGKGLGRRLVAEVLGGRDGWLLAWPSAPAYQAYLRWGWRERGGFGDKHGERVAVLTYDQADHGG